MKRGEGERTLERKIASPAFPSVCIVVFTVSTGVRIILNAAAAALANTVFASAGKFFKYLFDFSSARMPTFAAVSPKRDTGPWTSAAVIENGGARWDPEQLAERVDGLLGEAGLVPGSENMMAKLRYSMTQR